PSRYQVDSGLSPVRNVRRQAHNKKRDTKTIHFDVSSFPQHNSCSYSVTSKIMLPVKHRNKNHL
ncbi:hypothetical protein, partial [Enterocloster clostridioformis]